MINGHNGGPPLEDFSGLRVLSAGIIYHPLFDPVANRITPVDPSKGHACHYYAFNDLLFACEYKEGTVVNRGRKMTIQPGQLLGAISWLAERWNWTPKKVRVFIDKLTDCGFISKVKVDQKGDRKGDYYGNQQSYLSVCNFDKYSLEYYMQGIPLGTPVRTPSGHDEAKSAAPITVKGNQLNGSDPHGSKAGADLLHMQGQPIEIYPACATETKLNSVPRARAEVSNNIYNITTPVEYVERGVGKTIPSGETLFGDVGHAPKPKKASRALKSETSRPANWSPDSKGLAFAVEKGMTPEIAQFEFDRFCARHDSQGAKFKDWDAAWRTWCLNWVKFSKSAAPFNGNKRPSMNDMLDQAFGK